MIQQITVTWDKSGDYDIVKVPEIPRIGESVHFRDRRWIVADVYWNFIDREITAGVAVSLRLDHPT